MGCELFAFAGPVCDKAFSTLEGAREEDDLKCRSACSEMSSGECAAVRNTWLCVALSIQGCYIPNSNSYACHIEVPGPEDSHRGTCTCPNSDLGPCTFLEAEATAYAWKPTLSQFWKGASGVIVAKNNRALWPLAPSSWRYEAGPQYGKCEQRTWIRGVFCLGRLFHWASASLVYRVVGSSGHTSVSRLVMRRGVVGWCV